MSEIIDFLKEMFDCFIEDVFPILGMISFVLLLIVGLAVLQYKASEWTCEMKATIQGLQWTYRPVKGCMVKTENGWLDYDKLIYKKEVK